MTMYLKIKKILSLFSLLALLCAGIFACTNAEYENNQAAATDYPFAEGAEQNAYEGSTEEASGASAGVAEPSSGAFANGSSSDEDQRIGAPPEEEAVDGQGDFPEDAADLEPAAFRVSQFGIMSPPLCVASDDDASCHNVDMMVNDAFDAMLNDVDSPMDLMGVFEGMPLEETTSVSFGKAACIREEGEIISCTPVGPTTFSILSVSQSEDCVGGVNGMEKYLSAPCFVTEAKNFQFVMQGMLIGLVDAQIMGTLEPSEYGYDISGGFITGFVPEFMAQIWSFDVDFPEGSSKMSFDQLFHRTAYHPNDEGEMGWNLVLGFSGAAVALDTL